MPNDTLPDWERVLSSAARLQRILPEAILVGGTAAEARLNCRSNGVQRIGHLPNAAPQMPDALGGVCVQASQQLCGDGQDVVE